MLTASSLKSVVAGAAFAVLPLLAGPVQAAPPMHRPPIAEGEQANGVSPVQYRHHRRHHYGYRPFRPYRPYVGFYYGYRPLPPPVTYYETRPYVVRRGAAWLPDDVARCASRFRSFNVRTGTYITYEGVERLCPYLR